MLRIVFSNTPWWLLLLIPAVVLSLIPYFRVPKRYRKTRNRVVSLVLHITALTLAIFALSGIRFVYRETNTENEIILLVDCSDTTAKESEIRDEFVQTVLDDGRYDGYRIGVVTFGFTQEYAVPLTYDVDSIYEQYLAAKKPDASATDLAAALEYTKTLFEHPESSKIVLIGDGRETDESALEVIESVIAQGTLVDTAYIPSEYSGAEVQVTAIAYPEKSVALNEEFSLGVSVMSEEISESVMFEIYDNGEKKVVEPQSLAAGFNSLSFPLSFDADGLHEVRVVVTTNNDQLEENNEYCSYYYLRQFNKVLIFEHKDESDELVGLLTQGDAYEVDVKDIASVEIPEEVNDSTDPERAEAALQEVVDGLRAYDQIVLNNIANADMPQGLDKALYSYVYDYGGGLFTAGGNNEEGEAHAYNRQDLYGTILQEMLPVEAIEYTPPVGVMIIIDISGSMEGDGSEGMTKLWWAKQGAISCLEALTERDYIGVMTLDTVYNVILPLTSATQKTVIQRAIDGIGSGGSTNYTNALSRAGAALIAESRVSKRHIILVTDGEPGDEEADYLSVVDSYYRNNGITVSAVGIGGGSGKLKTIVEYGHGTLHIVEDQTKLQEEMREDLNAPSIKEVNYEPFNPIIANTLSPLLDGVEYGVSGESRRVMTVKLNGFYGVKLKNRAVDSPDLVLMGDYEVPIYAQWTFGKGMVGSFMCDLSGTWSAEFLQNANGQKFLLNVVEGLMPSEDIRPNPIQLKDSFEEDNYHNSFSIFTDLEEGQTIEGTIIEMNGAAETENVVSLNAVTPEAERADALVYVTVAIGEENQYSRCSFIVRETAVYKIVLNKRNADGTVAATLEFYKAFSYSEEYDAFPDEEAADPEALFADLAERGDGEVIVDLEDPWEIFASFISGLQREYDPTLVLIIVAMVAFLLDIAVRKFKFKWPHEIVREFRRRKGHGQREMQRRP